MDDLRRIHRVVTISQNTEPSKNVADIPERPECLENYSEPSTFKFTEHTSVTDEYQQFMQADHSVKNLSPNVTELQGDLFECNPTVSLAHCVSKDFKMTWGIALLMRRKFGGIEQLRS